MSVGMPQGQDILGTAGRDRHGDEERGRGFCKLELLKMGPSQSPRVPSLVPPPSETRVILNKSFSPVFCGQSRVNSGSDSGAAL